MGFWSFVGQAIGSAVVGAAVLATGPFAIPVGASVAGLGFAFKDMAGDVAEDGLGKDALKFVGDCYIGGGSGVVADGAVRGLKIAKVCSKCKK